MSENKPLTVGRIARLTGVSVRTLHHYDDIALVVPSGRTSAGYRVYSDADVERLHQVLTYRELGFSLEQIATLLALLCTEATREVTEVDGKQYFLALGPRCLPQGAPTSPGLTNTLCMRLDRRLQGAAIKLGWRYTRYADDLTFSLPNGHKSKPGLGKLLGTITAIAVAEGFAVHPDKTRVSRSGGRQREIGRAHV